jgi:hypothetical protein
MQQSDLIPVLYKVWGGVKSHQRLKYGHWLSLPTTDRQWYTHLLPCLCKSLSAAEIVTISWAEDTSDVDNDKKKLFPKYQQNQQDVIK